MKARFFSLLAMVLCLASCQKDVDGLDVNVGGDTATISVVLPENAITRAAAKDTNSAWSGLANEEKEELTVTLYIFDESGKPSQEPYTADLTEGQLQANFEVRLVPDRHYTFVAWAGQKSAANLFTLGVPAQKDWTITLSDWTAMNEQRDAFTGIYSTAKEKEGKPFTSSSDITLNLTRPFAKLRVVTTDMEWLKNTNITPAYAEVSYEVELPKTFNAYSEAIGTEFFTQKAHETFEIKDYTKDAEGKMTLFTDYILVPESRNVKFTLTVYEANENGTGKGKEIETTSFVTDIFVERNHLTTIEGDILTDGNNIKVTVEEDFANAQSPEDKPYYIEYKEAGSAQALAEIIDEINNSTTNEQTHISLTGNININELLGAVTYSTRAASSASITIASGKEVVLDIKDYNITGTDNETASYGMFNIQPGAKLTIEGGNGTIQLTATNNRGWNAYSSVISNQRGEFVLNGGTIEHLGGTDMAYGLDILTNTGAGDAKATINGGTIQSTYRAVRQFLNSTKATAELVVNGGTIDGRYNKSIWMQNASKSVNPGKLVVGKNANLYGDVMVSGAGAPELDIELSVAVEALKDDATVIPSNIPAGYDIYVKNGNWVVEYGLVENGNEVTVLNAAGLKWLADQVNDGDTFEGKTVKLGADIDLKNENWTPIGYWTTFNGTFDGQNHTISNLKHHGTEEDCYVGLFGYTENATIKNLTINNVDLKLVANTSWAGGHMGALVGNIEGETVIENIKVTGDVKIDGNKEMAGAGRIGGVVGGNVAKVSFKNVVVDANAGSFVQGNTSIGGIAGQIQQVTTFENCSANIDVTAQQFYAGGIVGLAYQNTSFTNCVTSGKVSVLAGREGNNNDLYRVGAIAGGWDDHENLTLVLEGCSTTCELSGASADGRTATAFDCAGYVGRGYSAVVGAKVSVNGTVYEYAGEGVYKIGDSYVVNTADALVAALDKKYDVTFGGDIKIDPANMSNAYGKTGINVHYGQTIDGNGYTLNIKGAGGTWDSGINTTGGLIKNLTVTGSFRGIFINHTGTHSEKVILENVTIGGNGTVYTISCDQGKYQGIEATNCTFNGWTSFAKTAGEAKFVNCNFGEGSGYKYCRPYSATEFVNCTFCPGYAVDKTQATVTFTDCTWEE